MNKKILTINDMIDTLNRAKALIGGDAPIDVITDHGILNLTINDNIIIGNDNKVNKLIIDAGDWGSPIKTMDIV